MIDLDTGEQRRLAYHESGHAVVQHILGCRVKFVGIGRIAEPHLSWTGSTQTEKEVGPHGAVIAIAGPLAESRYLNVPATDEELIHGRRPSVDFDDGGWEGDGKMFRHFADESQIDNHIHAARSLIQQEDVWAAISAIASELICPTRLKSTALKEMPADVRAAVLSGFHTPNHDDRHAFYCYLRGDEASLIIKQKRRSATTFVG